MTFSTSTRSRAPARLWACCSGVSAMVLRRPCEACGGSGGVWPDLGSRGRRAVRGWGADAAGCLGRAGNRALGLGRRPLLGSCPRLCRWPPDFSVWGASSGPRSRRAVFLGQFHGTFWHGPCENLPGRLHPSYFSTSGQRERSAFDQRVFPALAGAAHRVLGPWPLDGPVVVRAVFAPKL